MSLTEVITGNPIPWSEAGLTQLCSITESSKVDGQFSRKSE